LYAYHVAGCGPLQHCQEAGVKILRRGRRLMTQVTGESVADFFFGSAR
jgi:hypothetical protein